MSSEDVIFLFTLQKMFVGNPIDAAEIHIYTLNIQYTLMHITSLWLWQESLFLGGLIYFLTI